MSLAYKLWKIGSVLTEDDIKKSIKVEPKFKEGVEPVYLNIDFVFDENKLLSMSINHNAVSEDKFFFSKKIGGTSNAYYLFPNIILQNEKPEKGRKNIINTLKFCTKYFCKDDFQIKIESIISILDNSAKKIQIDNLPKDNYLIWLSINGKTFYELMPEVWDNYYKHPFVEAKTKMGFDIFTNKETEIGYKTDFKAFSYDQYHDSLKHRIDENLPLSKESAKSIKYAWIYILDNLVFYYKGLEYILIPNLFTDDKEVLKTIIKRFVKANKKLSNRWSILHRLKKEEKKLKDDFKKLQQKKMDVNETERSLKKVNQQIDETDLGMVKEMNEQAVTLDEYINMVNLDYLFVIINKTQKSFEITGTIEDVIPSRMSKVVEQMRKYQIEDLVTHWKKDRKITYLQDYFNRYELFVTYSQSPIKYKTIYKNHLNPITTERLYLTNLLLTDTKIKRSELLRRFEINRNYSYDKKKRMTKEGFQEWIQYPSSFVEDENKIIQFFASLKKIQEN